MNERAIRVLELDTILEVLAQLASTEGGRRSCHRLEPSTDRSRVEQDQERTGEARRWLDEDIRLPLGPIGGLDQPEPAIELLRVEGRVAEPAMLVMLRAIAVSAKECKNTLRPLRASLEEVWRLLDDVPDLDPLIARIDQTIDRDTLEIRDEASRELAGMRKSLLSIKRRVQRTIDSLIQKTDTRKLLQEPIVTYRNGRSVVPVRAEFKQRFPGIVHGSSTSGATLFVEPTATVELNNELASLTSRIEQECLRILRDLTALAREYRSELGSTAETLLTLDRIEAMGSLSRLMDANTPRLVSEETLNLKDARHPLLIPEVSRRASDSGSSAKPPVPLGLTLGGDHRALVLTGPNTGGKTVALKTVGLLALMVQTGLQIPAAAESSFPVFRSVFADIGDEQSISSSLSTFSAHMETIIGIDRELELPSLVILDEVGTGTDPGEGGALGTALVEHLCRRGALLVVSTHHQLLKTYATTTPGVEAASFAFDPETYAPTYHLIEGAAGRSLAFEMSLRLGLPAAIVDRARELRSEGERQLEELSLRLEQESKELDRQRREYTEKLEGLDRDKKTLSEERLASREALDSELRAFRERLANEYSEAQEELAHKIDAALEAVENRATAEREIREAKKATKRELQAALEHRVGDLAQSEGLGDNAPGHAEPIDEALSPGDSVITPLGLRGELAHIKGSNAEVIVGDKRVRVPVEGLVKLDKPDRGPAEPPSTQERAGARSRRGRAPHKRTESSGGGVRAVLLDKSGVTELNLIGCNVDEALSRADKFLDDAIVTDVEQVRLVHGQGTGRLRKALRDFLNSHPMVAELKPDSRDGATLITLKD